MVNARGDRRGCHSTSQVSSGSSAEAHAATEAETVLRPTSEPPRVTPPPGAFPPGKVPPDWRVEEVRDDRGNVYSVVPEGVKTGWTGLPKDSGLPRGFTIDSEDGFFSVKDAAGKSFAIGDSFQDAIDTAKHRMAHGLSEPEESEATEEAPRTEARVTAPSGVAEFRGPSARVVSDAHVPVINSDAILNQAVQTIVNNAGEMQRLGLDPSQINTISDINAALQIASDHIKSNLDPRAYGPISFEGQKALAADLGMSVEDLLSRKGGEAFNAEQLVAARALLEASKQRVMGLARAATDMGDAGSLDAFTTGLAQHQAIQEVIAGVRAEAGRALGSLRIQDAALPGAKITSVLDKLPADVKAEAARLISQLDPTDPNTVRRVNQFTEKIRPATTLEKLHEYYRNALLSSPHTLIVKTASEAAMAAMETMKKVVAGGLSKFKETPDRFAAEAWYYAKGMAQALAEHARPILTGDFQLEGSPGFERASAQAIKGRVGQVVRAPSEAMSRMTNLIYAGNYLGEINSQAARQAIIEGLDGDAFHARQEYLAHHPTPEMQKAAHDVATTNTFQNELSGVAKKIDSAIAHKPDIAWLGGKTSVAPGKFLFPFYRTPINLLKASLTHVTPYELLNGIAKGDTDAMARGVLGSSIAAGLGYLALNGTITGGGPTDFRKQETLRATGWQPYSLKIGDRYFSYKRFEPVGLVAGLVADTVHGILHGDPEVVGMANASSAIKQIMRNLDDLPFLGTLSNLLQSIHDPTAGVAGTVNRLAGSLVPAAIANVAMTIDPTVRRPRNPLQAIAARIPGLTGAAQPIIDVRGQEVKRPPSQLGGGNPFEWQSNRHDPVTAELARLGIPTPQPPKKVKLQGKDTELTQAEQTQLVREENQVFYDRMKALVTSPSWKSRTEEQKKTVIENVRREISEGTKGRVARLRRQAQADLTRSSLRLPD